MQDGITAGYSFPVSKAVVWGQGKFRISGSGFGEVEGLVLQGSVRFGEAYGVGFRIQGPGALPHTLSRHIHGA